MQQSRTSNHNPVPPCGMDAMWSSVKRRQRLTSNQRRTPMAQSGAGPVVGSHIAQVQRTTFPVPLKELPRLPAGFPAVLDSPLAWSGYQLAQQTDYILVLDEHDVREVEHALERFKSTSHATARTRTATMTDLRDRIRVGRRPHHARKLSSSQLGSEAGPDSLGHSRGQRFRAHTRPEPTKVSSRRPGHAPSRHSVACCQPPRPARQKGQHARYDRFRPKCECALTETVHIVADDSSKEKSTHHRHSTAPIVRQSNKWHSATTGLLTRCPDVPQRRSRRHCELADEKHGSQGREVHHCLGLHRVQRACSEPSRLGSNTCTLRLAICSVSQSPVPS